MKLSTIRPFIFEEEAINGCGEDSYFFNNMQNGIVVMGVFDGCGGVGARRYPAVSNRKGAWIGSQAAAYAVDIFIRNNDLLFNKSDSSKLQPYVSKTLKEVKEKITQQDAVIIGGTLNKSLPTTISVIAAKQSDSSELLCEYLWAGDSRGFILDKRGLCQLTKDDIDMNADDAFANLREDGILTNIANGDRDFTLHSGVININEPVMLISATDGCFGYFLTPMNFENVILDSLINAKDPDEWHTLLCSRIKAVTGDDYTMTIACFGFDSFFQMQHYYLNRQNLLVNEFIDRQDGSNDSQLEELWKKYKASYYRCQLNTEI